MNLAYLIIDKLYPEHFPSIHLDEGLTIPAELSKDGQEHSVNSKEEFDLYYDVAKDRELNKQRRILVEKGE